MKDASWGKPDQRNFARRYIREIVYDNVSIMVHVNLVAIFTEFFRQMSDAYMPFPLAARAFMFADTSHQGLGCEVSLPGAEFPAKVQYAAVRLGLTIDDDSIRFEGTPAEADEISRDIIQNRTTGEDSIENSLVEMHRPGTRSIAEGDVGRDVHFLQMFMVDEFDNAVFGASLTARVREFQTIRNLEPDGVAGQEFWLSMFPERPRQVGPADGGMWVRMVQAALVALDYSANPITSQYGSRTTRDVRWLQQANDLRVNGFVRGPEWGVLTHRPVDGLPLE